MDERRSDKGFQPEVTSSAQVTGQPLESAVVSSVATASFCANAPNPVLVSAGTTDTASSQGIVEGPSLSEFAYAACDEISSACFNQKFQLSIFSRDI